MTDLEKDIYNKYLRASRLNIGKPYKTRINFENFENEPAWYHVKKLSVFFEKYNHINIDDFFNAPYVIYPEKGKTYGIDFYSSYNAVKVYDMYTKKMLKMDPDSDLILNKTKDGVKFILTFCKEQKIPLKKYFTHRGEKFESFWTHLQESRINVYCLFLCEDIYRIYNQSDKELINFMLSDLMHNFNMYRTVYYSSKKTRQIISEIKSHFSS